MVRRQFELDEQTLDEVIKELAALCMRDALRKFSREIRRNHGLDFFTRKGLNSGDGIVGRAGLLRSAQSRHGEFRVVPHQTSQ